MSRARPTASYTVQTWRDAHGHPSNLGVLIDAECAGDALQVVLDRGYSADIHDVRLTGCLDDDELIPAMAFLLQRAGVELQQNPACSRDLFGEISLFLAYIGHPGGGA